MMRTLIVAISLLLAAQTALSQTVNVRVVDRHKTALDATIGIGGHVVEAGESGQFTFDLPDGDVFAFDVSAAGFYEMRHTFSRAELLAASDQSGRVTIPDIVLVKRQAGRSLFVFAGDTMMGRRYASPQTGEPVLIHSESVAVDTKALLAHMKPYFDLADYSSVNLETPIFDTPPGEAAPKFVTFYSPPETLAALNWAGVDYAALGNNHIYDFLDPGLSLSLENMQLSALDYSGAGLDQTAALKPHTETLSGTEYDLFSFVGWTGGTPSQSADIDKGGAALGTTENLITTATASADRGAAPIVQYHGGLEYVDEPTMAAETRLKQAIDAGASLVIAHHPHVFQGLEVYNDKLIAWSLGNFLFDQYFYAPQSSALLFVWMDGDTLHHAETVPIYVKGYVPTPATGAMRRAINQRVASLSDRRDTVLSSSGGHAMLNRVAPPLPAEITRTSVAPAQEHNTIASLQTVPWDQDIHAVVPAAACLPQTVQYRIGQDLLARGDFDGYDTFNSPDRSWLNQDANQSIIQSDNHTGDKALSIHLPSDAAVRTGMRKFMRVFARGNPMTVSADVTATTPTKVRVYRQRRAERQGLSDALENGRMTLLGEAIVTPGGQAPFEINFDSPRVGARSIRILIEAETLGDDAGELVIDDLSLIEWRTPFQALGDIRGEPKPSISSHLQMSSSQQCGIEVHSR